MSTAQQLFLSRSGHQIVFRPEGRCTAMLAEAISHFIRLVPTAADDDIYFDLGKVSALESTFAGLLIKLLKQSANNGPSVHLLTPSQPVMASLTQMGIAPMLDVADTLPEQADHWRALPVEDVDPQELADLIIESHEALIAADPRNEAAFRKVVDVFKAEREREARNSADRAM